MKYTTNSNIVGKDHTQVVNARRVCEIHSDAVVDFGLDGAEQYEIDHEGVFTFCGYPLPHEKIYLRDGHWLVTYPTGFQTQFSESEFKHNFLPATQ